MIPGKLNQGQIVIQILEKHQIRLGFVSNVDLARINGIGERATLPREVSR